MTYTITNFPMRDRLNSRVVREVTAVGGAYVTGGESIDAAGLGMGTVFGVYGTISNGSAVLVGWFDFTNQQLKWFVPNTGSEVANGLDLTGYNGTLLITGKD